MATRMFARLTGVVVLVSLALPGALSAQTPGVSLAEAVRLAEQVQPAVVQAQANVHTAGAQVRSAWGAYLPNLRVSSTGSSYFSQGTSRVDPVTGQLTTGNSTNRTISTSISASLDLFTGFRRGAEMKAAHAGEDAADASLVYTRYEQALATTNQFFDALAARQLVAVRQASVRRAEEQLKVSVAKLRAGSATRSDSLRSLVTLGTAQLDRIDAETQLASAEANLARLIGQTGRVEAADDSAYYRVIPEVDTVALRAEVQAGSPQVQSAQANATVAQASLKASRSSYWPSLTLGANTGWNGSQFNDYNLLNQRQLSLQLSWELFNGFSRELTVAQRRGDMETSTAEANEAQRQVLADLTSRLAELDAARTRIAITQTSVTAAREDLRVQQERYRVGLGTIVDLLTSQEALSQTEVNVVNARFDYLRAKAQLEALAGHAI